VRKHFANYFSNEAIFTREATSTELQLVPTYTQKLTSTPIIQKC